MEVILKPVLSEKMTTMTEKLNRVAFVVNKNANKFQIKNAVEQMYGVTVKEVNTMVYEGDAKQRYSRTGMLRGRTNSFKKAIVTLAQGDVIDFFSNI